MPAGDDIYRQFIRAPLTAEMGARLIRHRPPRNANRAHAVRQAENYRLALREVGQALRANRTQLVAIFDDLATGPIARPEVRSLRSAADLDHSPGLQGRAPTRLS